MRYRTILLAVDIEADNAAVLDYAFAFAEKAGATLHTLHALSAGPGIADDAGYAAMRERAKAQMEVIITPHSKSSSRGKAYVDMNEPITAITETAAKLSADLIMVSTSGRQGVERLALGSVAQGVLEEAKVPVLVLKNLDPARTSGPALPRADD